MTYDFEGKTEKEAIETAMEQLQVLQDEFDVEIVEVQKGSLFKKGNVKIRIHLYDDVVAHRLAQSAPSQDTLPLEKVTAFLTAITEKMGCPAEVEVLLTEEKKVTLRLNSEHSSILIGKKGKNLDALQLLANVFMGKLGEGTTRVILDCENYRIRREEFLVRLAYTTADKVIAKKNDILLDPMNPYERRLIHTTLNTIHDIETNSEGNGLYKQVRVSYKGR